MGSVAGVYVISVEERNLESEKGYRRAAVSKQIWSIMNFTDDTTHVTDTTTTSTLAANISSESPSPLGCDSLAGKGLTVSSTNTSTWAVVHLDCDAFGHRPSGGISKLTCLDTGKWDHGIPTCEWSWNLTMQEKIIFGTAVAAVSFTIVIVAIISIAYFCCYVKRKQEDEKIYNSSLNESSPRTVSERHYQGSEPYPITYLAYQDLNDGNYDNCAHTGTLDKPWLGYIPRPRVTV